MRNSFVKFLIVGTINTGIGLSAIYFCLNWLQFHYWTATFVGNGIGAMSSFLLNKRFTFQSGTNIWPSMLRFVLVILFCYVFSYKIGFDTMEWLLNKGTLPKTYLHELAVLAGSLFYTITNYLGQRYFVFNEG